MAHSAVAPVGRQQLLLTKKQQWERRKAGRKTGRLGSARQQARQHHANRKIRSEVLSIRSKSKSAARQGSLNVCPPKAGRAFIGYTRSARHGSRLGGDGQASRCSLRPNHPEAGCCFTSINQNTALHFTLGVGVSVGVGHLRDTNSEKAGMSSLRLRNGHLSKQYVELYIDGVCQAPPGNRALLLVMRALFGAGQRCLF